VRIAHAATSLAVFGSILLALSCSSEDGGVAATTKKDSGVDARRPYPSFQDDVLPIVQKSCALTACHSSKQSNLGIFLTYDGAQVYAELQKTSPTATGQKFVVPGDPTKSYVMTKLDGKQATLASSCTAIPNCGTEMPPGEPAGTLLPTEQRETFRKWIAEGAKDN